VEGLHGYLERRGFETIADVVGLARPNRVSD